MLAKGDRRSVNLFDERLDYQNGFPLGNDETAMLNTDKHIAYWQEGAAEDWEFAELNAFNIEGRYPDRTLPTLERVQAEEFLRRSEEVYRWLMSP